MQAIWARINVLAFSDLVSIIALVVAAFALWYAWRSARAAEKSAAAADTSNKISKESLLQAIQSNLHTKVTLENEFKRVKGRAYWALNSAYSILDRMHSFDPKLADLKVVEDLLSIYGYTLSEQERECLRQTLYGINLVITFQHPREKHKDYQDLKEKVRRQVLDAEMTLREEWMASWSGLNELKSS